MPLDYSFDTDKKEKTDLNPLALTNAAPQATQNPLGTMASAASPGLTSPFDATFGPQATTNSGGGESIPDKTASGAASASPGVTAATTPAPSATAGSWDPWSSLAGTPSTGTAGATPTAPPPVQTAPAAAKGGEIGGTAPTSSPGGNGDRDTNGDVTTGFKDLAAQLQSATDPQQKAILHDKLSRDIFGTLSDAGHDVKWDGDQLVVDGRRYIVGGTGPSSAPSAIVNTPGLSAATAGGTATGQATARPAIYHPDLGGIFGFETSKLNDPGKSSEKYTPAAKGMSQALGAGVQMSRGSLDDMVGYLQQHGFGSARVAGEDKIDFGDGHGPIDVLADQGDRDLIVFQNTYGNPTWEGAHPDDVAKYGHGGDSPNGAMRFDDVFQPTPGGAGTGQTSGVPLAPGGDPAAWNGPGPAPWTNPTATGPASSGSAYTPGTIDDSDLNGLSLDEILRRIGKSPDPAALPTDYQAGKVDSDYQAGRISNDPLTLGRVGTYDVGKVGNAPLDTYKFDGFKDVGGALGELGAGKSETATEDLVMSILQHPESYPPQVVDMLKAKSKDELAQMANSDEEDLKAAGFRTGNQDSNWLASEQLASKGRRDQALVSSNRAVDLTAAEKNNADKRAAAALGSDYATAKSNRLLNDRNQRFTESVAGEGMTQAEIASKNKASQFAREGEALNEDLRGTAYDRNANATTTNAGLTEREAAFKRTGELSNEDLRNTAFKNRTGAQTTNEQLRADAADRNLKAAQANIDNQFKSAEEKRAAVALASDTTLKAAAQKGDRRALEEGFKQKAAELGQSAEKLKQDYLLTMLQDATTRRGQDVNSDTSKFIAQLGASIDRAKLSQAGEQFTSDLMFRIMALQQADRQFGAQYGLDLVKTQHTLDQSAFDRTFGQ